MGKVSHLDLDSRRNWTVCWRWSISILAAEFALVVALVGFAIGSRPVSRVKSESMQIQQAQQQRPGASRKTCPLADIRKTLEL
jgi:hypothetical protein